MINDLFIVITSGTTIKILLTNRSNWLTKPNVYVIVKARMV